MAFLYATEHWSQTSTKGLRWIGWGACLLVAVWLAVQLRLPENVFPPIPPITLAEAAEEIRLIDTPPSLTCLAPTEATSAGYSDFRLLSIAWRQDKSHVKRIRLKDDNRELNAPSLRWCVSELVALLAINVCLGTGLIPDWERSYSPRPAY